MSRLTTKFNPNKKGRKAQPVYAYIDNQRRKIGYAYTTKNGSLCVKGDKVLDKNQLGRLLINGVYITHD